MERTVRHGGNDIVEEYHRAVTLRVVHHEPGHSASQRCSIKRRAVRADNLAELEDRVVVAAVAVGQHHYVPALSALEG